MQHSTEGSSAHAQGRNSAPYEKPTLNKGPALNGITAGGIGSPTFVYSDVRLKRDIRAIEHLESGLTLYRFRYLWSDVEMVGVMAQEVIEVAPEAVLKGADGFYRVDYAHLGLRCTTYAEWLAERSLADAA